MVVAVMERAFTRRERERGERCPERAGKAVLRAAAPPLAWDDGCSVGRIVGRTADPSNCSSLGEGEGESEEKGMGQMREGGRARGDERGATSYASVRPKVGLRFRSFFFS